MHAMNELVMKLNSNADVKTFFSVSMRLLVKKIINKKKHKKYNSVSFSLLWEYTSTVTTEYMHCVFGMNGGFVHIILY